MPSGRLLSLFIDVFDKNKIQQIVKTTQITFQTSTSKNDNNNAMYLLLVIP